MDQFVRIVVGLALLSFAAFGPRTPWGLVGIVPLATGLLKFCPLYRLVGFSSCRSAGAASYAGEPQPTRAQDVR